MYTAPLPADMAEILADRGLDPTPWMQGGHQEDS